MMLPTPTSRQGLLSVRLPVATDTAVDVILALDHPGTAEVWRRVITTSKDNLHNDIVFMLADQIRQDMACYYPTDPDQEEQFAEW